MADVLDRGKKKKLRKKLEAGKATTRAECLAIYGTDAHAVVDLIPQQQPVKLRMSDVQNVLLWALTHDSGEMPRWLVVRNKPLLHGALVCLVPGLSSADAREWHRTASSTCTTPLAIQMPKSHHARLETAVATELLQVKLSKKRKAATIEAARELSSPTSLHPGQTPHGGWLLSYVRTFAARAEELRENGYPLSGEPVTLENVDGRLPYAPMSEFASGSLHGSSADGETRAHLLAIDCEMVLVRGEHMVCGGWPLVKQLARVAVLNEAGEVLMDELVRPERPVVDYLTQHSGITEPMLERASLTLREARDRVVRLIGAPQRAALVGHSLECDLHALRLSVPPDACVLDTALLFPLRVRAHGPPAKSALRHLSARHLRREIQQGDTSAHGGGHCPTEDALAALDLARLKLTRGRAYGTPDALLDGSCEPLREPLERSGLNYHAVGEEGALNDVAAHGDAQRVACADDVTAARHAAALLSTAERRVVWLGLRGRNTREALEALGATLRALPPNVLVTLVGAGERSGGGGPSTHAAGPVVSEDSACQSEVVATDEKGSAPSCAASSPPGWVSFAVTEAAVDS